MSLMVNGWNACAPAGAAAASRSAASTAATQWRISNRSRANQVVVEGQNHYCQQQREADALAELHRALGNRSALENFDQIVHQVSAVEQRNRQQVEHAEADAEQREQRE